MKHVNIFTVFGVVRLKNACKIARPQRKLRYFSPVQNWNCPSKRRVDRSLAKTLLTMDLFLFINYRKMIQMKMVKMMVWRYRPMMKKTWKCFSQHQNGRLSRLVGYSKMFWNTRSKFIEICKLFPVTAGLCCINVLLFIQNSLRLSFSYKGCFSFWIHVY